MASSCVMPRRTKSSERVVEGALLDIEMAAGARLEPRRDLRAVHGAPGECLQDEDVERPLEEGAVLRSHNVSPENLGATMRVERESVKIRCLVCISRARPSPVSRRQPRATSLESKRSGMTERESPISYP